MLFGTYFTLESFWEEEKTYLSFLYQLIEVTIGIYIQSGYGKSLS